MINIFQSRHGRCFWPESVYKSRHNFVFCRVFFSKSRHEGFIALFLSVLPPFLDELGFGAEHAALKSLLSGQFALVIAFPVVFRRVVANGEARPLCVVVLDISLDGLSEGVGAPPALFDLELDVEFLLYPAVQGFVDGVVRGLSGPGHGADDVRVPDEFVVGHGCVHAALVCVQDDGLQVPLEQAHDIRQAVGVLVPVAPAACHSRGEDLLGEHVEVEGDLVVVAVHLEGRHVGHDDLPWAVHCLPCGEDEVGVQVPHLPGLVVHTVPGLCLDAEVPVALVGVVVADVHLHVDAHIGRCPAVAVGGMLLVHFLDKGDDLLSSGVAAGRLAFSPLVVPRTAHAHQWTDVLDGVVAGQQVHYFELFGFKRTYSRSPSAFV